ncbi:MAG: RusA family crossover junction endodeoxyribonuclease [Desulfovibrionaceae bacterium]|nr:RusA family crossover junction endodeoxyribonuclease [Desulfovibrionaceae bacterium]
MKRVLEFTLNCIPTPQARARHAVRCGHAVAYKAQRQRDVEATLDALLAPHAPAVPLSGAVELAFTAYMPLPKSAPRWARKAILEGQEIWHTKKGDLDNLCKNIADRMTRLQFWHDDNAVAHIDIRKVYSDRPRWKVIVQELGGKTL